MPAPPARGASATVSRSGRSPARSGSTSTWSSSSARPRACCRRRRGATRCCPTPTARSPGSPTADTRAARLHRLLLATLATSSVTLTLPRGDLRATSPTPRLPMDRPLDRRDRGHRRRLPSCRTRRTEFPATPAEHRLRGRYPHVRSGVALDDADRRRPDDVCSVAHVHRRSVASHELTAYDGDLSTVAVPRLDGVGVAEPTRVVGRLPARLLRPLPARGRPRRGARRRDQHHRPRSRLGAPQRTRPVPPRRHRRRVAPADHDRVDRRTPRGPESRRSTRCASARNAAGAPDGRRSGPTSATGCAPTCSRGSITTASSSRQRGSTVLASEMRFGGDDAVVIRLPDGRGIELQGSVDRIDRTRDGALVVTDHKTGGKASSRICRPTIRPPEARCSSCRAMPRQHAPGSATPTRSCTPSTG